MLSRIIHCFRVFLYVRFMLSLIVRWFYVVTYYTLISCYHVLYFGFMLSRVIRWFYVVTYYTFILCYRALFVNFM
jgi:hypothetical protein